VRYKERTRPRNDQEGGEERPTRELFEHLSWQANRGDREAAKRLRRILRANPDIWRSVGDLAEHLERSLIEQIARGNLVLGECVRLKAEEMRAALLAEATDEKLERLLIDELVVSWLEEKYAGMAAIQPQQFKRDARFWEQRYERAKTRYQTAIKELAALRNLVAHVGGIVPKPDVTEGREGRCGRPLESRVD
jgi:hypothetical protein